MPNNGAGWEVAMAMMAGRRGAVRREVDATVREANALACYK